MQKVVEVGGWEHECCGDAHERDAVVELTCFSASPSEDISRYVETHHDLGERDTITVRGRVADLEVQHPDGSTEPISRLPCGSALRGFDDEDDGHLERPWTGEPVVNDSGQFLLTVVT